MGATCGSHFPPVSVTIHVGATFPCEHDHCLWEPRSPCKRDCHMWEPHSLCPRSLQVCTPCSPCKRGCLVGASAVPTNFLSVGSRAQSMHLGPSTARGSRRTPTPCDHASKQHCRGRQQRTESRGASCRWSVLFTGAEHAEHGTAVFRPTSRHPKCPSVCSVPPAVFAQMRRPHGVSVCTSVLSQGSLVRR